MNPEVYSHHIHFTSIVSSAKVISQQFHAQELFPNESHRKCFILDVRMNLICSVYVFNMNSSIISITFHMLELFCKEMYTNTSYEIHMKFKWIRMNFIWNETYGGCCDSTLLQYVPWNKHTCLWWPVFMMTSLNGSIFRVTGLCAGNSPVTGDCPARGALMFSLIRVWMNGCENNREVGDLRR